MTRILEFAELYDIQWELFLERPLKFKATKTSNAHIGEELPYASLAYCLAVSEICTWSQELGAVDEPTTLRAAISQ